jgi:hypothetical protein
MPNRTIYIKNEDMPIWEQVYSPEWLHSVIQAARP